jgi:hypothetical protein
MIATWVGKHSDLLYCPARRPITFCVEGNVGAGKSTYLSMINDIGKCNEIQVVQEPVEQWRNVNGENLLERFYRDPKRYAFTFQQYVLLTRINRVCSRETRAFSSTNPGRRDFIWQARLDRSYSDMLHLSLPGLYVKHGSSLECACRCSVE